LGDPIAAFLRNFTGTTFWHSAAWAKRFGALPFLIHPLFII
jgi:hypothetical protein